MKKRRRDADTAPIPRCVYLCCYDDVERPLIADRSILESFDCRLHKQILHDAPDSTYKNYPCYNLTTMSRSMCIAFLSSLVHHEFILPRDVSYAEAVRVFEYEGIAVPHRATMTAASSTSTLEPVALGLGFCKAIDLSTCLKKTIDNIANSLLQWPRLQHGFTKAESGQCAHLNFTLQPSGRFWLRLSNKPDLKDYHAHSIKDTIYSLAKLRPQWITSTLRGVGIVFARLCQKGIIDESARDEKSFLALMQQGVELDLCHHFLSVKADIPRDMRRENATSGWRAKRSADFVQQILNRVQAYGAIDPNTTVPTDVKYCRAVVSMCEQLVRDSPNCAHIFSAACATEREKNITPERKALTTALGRVGFKILEWHKSDASDGRTIRPLVFPPSFFSAPCNGPLLLIEWKG